MQRTNGRRLRDRVTGLVAALAMYSVLAGLVTPFPGARTAVATPTTPIVIHVSAGAPTTIQIENVGPNPIGISTELLVEQSTPGGWRPVPLTDLHVISACSDLPVESCRSLAPHEFVRVPAWTGFSCSAQCNHSCRANVYSSGTFRYFVRDCQGRRYATSAAFVVPVTPIASAAAASPSPVAPAPTAPVGPGDAQPEPSAPAAECQFRAATRCLHETPTRTAVGLSPYSWCPVTVASTLTNAIGPITPARFSPIQTRAMRTQVPDACCYVQFAATRCR